MKTNLQTALRTYVRAREDFQAMRIRMGNRIGLKADGKAQEIEERRFNQADVENFKLIYKSALDQEKAIEKMINKILKQFPIYTEWLSKIKGVSNIAGGVLLSEIDIEVAVNAGKITQYAGINPGMVKGKKRVAKSSYKGDEENIISEQKNPRTKGTDLIVVTDELIRGDKCKPGFLSPYNKNLKIFLLGVLAGNFIKCQNSYALEFYYPYKKRLENSNQVTGEVKKGGEVVKKPWKDCTLKHRDDAAKRYMIKYFLHDLYAAWREIEGLPVRPPYSDEYLGRKHGD